MKDSIRNIIESTGQSLAVYHPDGSVFLCFSGQFPAQYTQPVPGFQSVQLEGGFFVLAADTLCIDQAYIALLRAMLNAALDKYDGTPEERVFSGLVPSTEIGRELGLPEGAYCIAIFSVAPGQEEQLAEILSDAVDTTGQDKVYRLCRGEIVLLKELSGLYYSDFEELCRAILQDAATETSIHGVGLGGLAPDVGGIYRSYQQARVSIPFVRSGEADVISFKNIVLEYLAHAPAEAADMLRAFSVNGELGEFFEDEFLHTFAIFLENNLNISEAARAAYMHRNTLKYKMDKLYKLTGLDIRNFHDAVLFRLMTAIRK